MKIKNKTDWRDPSSKSLFLIALVITQYLGPFLLLGQFWTYWDRKRLSFKPKIHSSATVTTCCVSSRVLRWLRGNLPVGTCPRKIQIQRSMISLEEFLHLLYRWQWLPVLTALSTIYFLYYFFHVVHKPRLIVKEGRFRKFLLQSCPMLSEYYWPTFWCFAAHAQTLIRALIRSRPSVPFRR